MKKALIAMSGGVDSSLAAKRMKDAGYECVGCTMKLYDNEDVGIERTRTCCSLDDVEDARSVAYSLGMPYYVFNFKDDFREKVIGRFVDAYENGATPNPCIDCNRFMKFEKLYQRAQILNCDYVVTGHYARIEQENGKFVLKKAVDETKDQSYVLYSLTQEQLAHTMFPLGGLRKTEVREIAEDSQFVNARKPDSQDICFVPDGDYASFIERHTGKKYETGQFLDTNGAVLGTHKGIVHYTIGQRKGLGIAAGKPVYVKEICVKDNTVILGDEKDLYARRFLVEDFNWISGEVPAKEILCKVKTRYRQKEQDARVIPTGERFVEIIFDQPQRAITRGQAAVLYDGDVVLGGGTIEEVKQMDYSRIKKNICDVIKEEQVKLGYRKESIRLYYPLLSLNRFLGTEYSVDEMQTELERFAVTELSEFGEVQISHKKDRFCFFLPEQATEWVYENTEHTGFLYDFVETMSKHFITIDDIVNQFRKYSEHVHFEKVQDQDFDYVVYFEDGEPDNYRYCLTDEQCHFIYHRFTVEDYQDL